MRKIEEREIDGKRYILTQYQTEKGVELATYIGKIAAEPIAKLYPYIPEEGKKVEQVPNEIWSEVFKAIFRNLSPREFSGFCKELLSGTNIIDHANRPINFNEDFAGDYGHLMMVIKEMLIFQFETFFQKLGKIIPTGLSRQGARVVQAK